MKRFSVDDIHDFITEVDRRGGPAALQASEYFKEMIYDPKVKIDSSVDPFSEQYVTAQLDLYKEITGHNVDQEITELTEFDFDRHLQAANPFAATSPSSFVKHYLRLGHVVSEADLQEGAHVLDMGAGWGVSSEFLGTLGCRVTAVDINSKFVELIQRRQERHLLPITAVVGTFDKFSTDERFDAILFYECLHHAVRPWDVISRICKLLKPDGALMFAGEPINDYWKHWGLRLDPLSIYCIAKFGWFESGWSESFIISCLERAGLSARIGYKGNDVGSYCVANKSIARLDFRDSDRRVFLTGDDLANMVVDSSFYIAEDHLIAKPTARLMPSPMAKNRSLVLRLANYRGRSINLAVMSYGQTLFQTVLCPGETEVSIDTGYASKMLDFSADGWIPAAELGTSDTRLLSFHILSGYYV